MTREALREEGTLRLRGTLARCRVVLVVVATVAAAVWGGSLRPSLAAGIGLGVAWLVALLALVDARRERSTRDRVIVITAAGDALLVALWIVLGSTEVTFIGLVVTAAAANAMLLKGSPLTLVGLLRMSAVAAAFWATRDLSALHVSQYLVAITCDGIVGFLVARLAGEERQRGRAQAVADRRAQALASSLRRQRAVHEATRAVTAAAGLDEALARICRAAGELFDASFTTLLLRAGDSPGVRAGWNMPEMDPAFLRDVISGAREWMPSGRALATREVVWVGDVDGDPMCDAEVRAIAKRAGWRCCLSIPLLSEGAAIGALGIYYHEPREVDADLRTVGELLAAEAVGAVLVAQLLDELRDQAVTDPLTKLYNFGYARDRLGEMLADATRKARSVSVLFIDIDNFKLINDREGHQRGDAVLVAFSLLLRAELRVIDIAARGGGDEFVVVMPDTAATGAAAVGERIRNAVAAAPSVSQREVTVSVGHATAPDAGATVDEVIRAADVAMYIAKHAGKNRVVGYADELSGDLLLGDEPPPMPWLEARSRRAG